MTQMMKYDRDGVRFVVQAAGNSGIPERMDSGQSETS